MRDWRLRIANIALYSGALAFFACWSIGWSTESRLFSDPAFAVKGPNRPDAVEAKGQTYYLEPTYAWQYTRSKGAIPYCFLVFLLGGAYVEFRKRKNKR